METYDDLNLIKNISKNNINYMIAAAKHSKNNAKHWGRYLRKEIVKGEIRLYR